MELFIECNFNLKSFMGVVTRGLLNYMSKYRPTEDCDLYE